MPEPKGSVSAGHAIGDMCARWVLDAVVELAYAVSKDFSARPEFYKGNDVPDEIVDFRSAYGYARGYPNKVQRQDLASPVFGASDGYSQNGNDRFRALREPLFDACVAYSERTVTEPGSGATPKGSFGPGAFFAIPEELRRGVVAG
jgi:hypothetical protein